MQIKLLLFISLTLSSLSLQAKDHDPNNYFKDRSWKVDAGKYGTLVVKNEYRAEPVKKPNKLNIVLLCPKTKEKRVIIKDYKYCGIDAVSVVGGKVELMLADFSLKDSRGYCTKRNKRYFPLPPCH